MLALKQKQKLRSAGNKEVDDYNTPCLFCNDLFFNSKSSERWLMCAGFDDNDETDYRPTSAILIHDNMLVLIKALFSLINCT